VNQDDLKDIHQCSFCGESSENLEFLIAGGPTGHETYICDKCIKLCVTIATEYKTPLDNYRKVHGTLHVEIETNLRPITRIPKKWVVSKSDLFCKTPNVTATSPNGNKSENFSIPKPLAYWMITKDKKLDLDELREKIKEDMARRVREVLGGY